MGGLYIKQLFGTDRYVILTEAEKPGHLTRLDDKGAFTREQAQLFTSAPELLEALRRIADDDPSEPDFDGYEPRRIALAAIARAEGR